MEREKVDRLVEILGPEMAKKFLENVSELDKRRRIPSKRVWTKRKRKIAIHEAGHAVVGHHFGTRPDKITIEPNFETETTASVKYSWNGDKSYKELSPDALKTFLMERIHQSLCCGVAGFCAEYIHARKPKKFKDHGGSGDFEDAKNFLREFLQNSDPNISYGNLVNSYISETVEILESKWKAVVALSEALIQRGTITGQEAVEIIEKSLVES